MEELTDLEYLESLIEEPLPPFIEQLPEAHHQQLREYVQKVIAHETAGLDKFFGSLSDTMKYIPNFVILSMTKKYIDPPISAKITSKLTLKQSLSVANGLSPEYLGEVASYQQGKEAAEILAGLKTKQAESVLKYVAMKHPQKALEIAEFASRDLLKCIAKSMNLNSIDETHLRSPQRKATYEKLKALQ